MSNLAKVDIFNFALMNLGAGRVSSPTDGTPNARACLQVYDQVRRAELRKMPYWNFAIKMAKLPLSATPPLFTRKYAYPLPPDYIVLADPYPETNYPDRDWVIQEGAIFTNGAYLNPGSSGQSQAVNYYTFTVTAANATVGAIYTSGSFTFTVQATISGGTVLSTIGSGSPAPSGTLTLGSGTGDATITYASYINSNSQSANAPPGPLDVRYVSDIQDPTLFDPLFANAFAAMISYNICNAITQSNEKKKDMKVLYTEYILEARRSNSFEIVSNAFPFDTYETVRL